MEKVRWWHYTVGTMLFSIVADGQIKRTRAGVPNGERPAIWFSCHPAWEPTASKGIWNSQTGTSRDATIAEMVHDFGPLIRIEVAATVARHTWADHQRIGRMDPRMADILAESAREHGADPAEWRVSYHDVPLADIVSVEASDDGMTWIEVGTPAPNGDGLMLESGFIARIENALAA